MTKSQFLLTLLVAAAAAGFGGFMGMLTMWGEPSSAQEKGDAALPEYRRKVVEATEFRIVDSKGVVRGLYGLTKSDDMTLTLHDGDGQPRALVSASVDGSSNIKLLDPNGIERVVQSLSPDGLSGFALNGADGRADLSLTATAEGENAIVLYGKNDDQVGVGLSVLEDGRSLMILGKDGSERLRLIVDEKGEPKLYFLNEDGTSYYSAGE